MRPFSGTLIGFSGSQVPADGVVRARLTVGTSPKTADIEVDFVVVSAPSAYNAILGRPSLNRLQAVVSTAHLLMKFPTKEGVGEVRADQRTARACYATSLAKTSKQPIPEKTPTPTEEEVCEIIDLRDEITESRPQPNEDLVGIRLYGEEDEREIRVGALLDTETRQHLVDLLQKYKDVFAWSVTDMPGINPDLICHSLNTNQRPGVIQKKRRFGEDRQKAIDEEVQKLLTAGFIRESKYPTWLSNVVMVKKASGKWRMCVDFTDLNKACPKDAYPLPNIDQLVDGTAGHQLLSFLDAFSGYNQIKMNPKDEEKTSFITDRGVFCYTVMPFGLKNAGATYQRMMDLIFKKQIGRNLEVYVDDMVVKSTETPQHLEDLEEIFEVLRYHNMKLNPAKCAFGVSAGKFLGFMITQRGIEANPEKCRAVLSMEPPKTVKEVQRLNGRLAALNRFLSRYGPPSLSCIVFIASLACCIKYMAFAKP